MVEKKITLKKKKKRVEYCPYVPKYIAVLIVHKVHTHENYNEKV